MKVILMPWHWRCKWTWRMLIVSLTATTNADGTLYRDWNKVWGWRLGR